MSESVTGTGEAQPADDIRSALAAAISSQDEIEAAEKPVEKSAKNGAAKADAQAESDAPIGDAAAEKPKAETESEAPETAEKSATEKPEADKAAASGKEPPSHWAAADKATFKTLPDSAKDFLLKRHKDMEADHTRKTQAIAALRSEYEPVDQLFAPYKDAMRAKGFSPRTLIEAWSNVERELAAGPDRAVKIIQGLVTGYKIPVEKISAALGLSAASARAEPAADGRPPAIDPPTTKVELPPELLNRISGIENFVATEHQRRASEAAARIRESENRVMSAIEEFKSKADEKGTLLHPHFEEVEDDMTALANAAIARKQSVPSLDKLYETAVWANPSTREKVRAAETQAAEKKRADEARAKAAAAKKASASVTGAPGAGQAPSGRRASDLSLREQLLEAVEENAA